MNKIHYISSAILLVFVLGCVKPFNPVTVSSNANILVIEGLINAGTDSTIVKLSRTVIIAAKTSLSPETKATVTVESSSGTIYVLPESSKIKGTYAAPALNLDNSKQYRLRVKTTNGKTYLSDLVDVKVTPPIDSIGFTVENSGIKIYVNSHDPLNKTRYYKYDYGETWQFHTKYPASYISDGSILSIRLPAQQIYACFATDSSTNSTINSTISLSQDVTYQLPITHIDSTSEKIGIRYSMLLSQTALTKEAYTFWDNLRKSTEQLGSIFDAQPSQLVGNIHNIADATEPVIGYISAGTVQKKRVFIDKSALPSRWQPRYPYSCSIDTAIDSPNEPQFPITYAWAKTVLIKLPAQAFGLTIINQKPPYIYLYTSPGCADCTIRGKTQQPAYWK